MNKGMNIAKQLGMTGPQPSQFRPGDCRVTFGINQNSLESWNTIFDGFDTTLSMFCRDFLLKRIYSHALFRCSYRCNDNFIKSNVLVFDIDNITPNKELKSAEVIEKLDNLGLFYAVAFTKSHMKLKDDIVAERFRIIIPLTNYITNKDQYRAFSQQTAKSFGWFEYADPKSFCPSQPWQPSISWVGKTEGEHLKKLDVPSEIVVPTPKYDLTTFERQWDGQGEMPLGVRTLRFLSGGIEPGKNNDNFVYASSNLKGCNLTFDEASKLLAGAWGKEHLTPEYQARLRAIYANPSYGFICKRNRNRNNNNE